jgi:two-component system, NtrC family, response regulator
MLPQKQDRFPMARVLIIDDDPVICRILSNAVEQLSHQAFVAGNRRDGLRLAAGEAVEVVFLDVQLPDGSGLEILPRLRSFPSQPEVIILTADGKNDSAEIAIKNGAWDYLQKPISVKDIALTLGRVSQYRQSLRQAQQAIKSLKLSGIIGSSPQMRGCYDLLAQAANSEASVLITGETGTGKELFARAIHENSRRAAGEFVVVDCASLPATLVESVLFGHEKGAFTGADRAREGLVKLADGGTLFLDEVGELPPELQKTLLRVLEGRRFRPLGKDQEINSDFRLVAATNRDLPLECARGLFREDLLFRLRAITIELPPLRGRLEDIHQITLAYIARICGKYGIPIKGLSPDFLEALHGYEWHGNVRELINALERAIANSQGDSILIAKHLPMQVRIAAVQSALLLSPAGEPDLQKAGSMAGQPLPSFHDYRASVLAESEQHYLRKLMVVAKGSIKKACALSGLGRTRLYTLLRKHSISRLGWN